MDSHNDPETRVWLLALCLFTTPVGMATLIFYSRPPLPLAYAAQASPPPAPTALALHTMEMARFLEEKKGISRIPVKNASREDLRRDTISRTSSLEFQILQEAFHSSRNFSETSTLPSDIQFLSRAGSAAPENLDQLEAIQKRIDQSPENYLNALLDTLPKVPSSYPQSRMEIVKLAISLTRKTGRYSELESILKKEIENAENESERLTLMASIEALRAEQRDRTPASGN